MLIKSDIKNRVDIETFVHLFYSKIVTDPLIGIIFTKIFPINMSYNIPIITDFWETILLDYLIYKKNAMKVHFEKNKIFPLQKNILMPGSIYSTQL